MVWREVGKFFLNGALVIFGSVVLQAIMKEHLNLSLISGGILGMIASFLMGVYCLKKGESDGKC